MVVKTPNARGYRDDLNLFFFFFLQDDFVWKRNGMGFILIKCSGDVSAMKVVD